MRVRYFLLGLLVGLLLALASGRHMWRRSRDQLAAPRRESPVRRTLTPL